MAKYLDSTGLTHLWAKIKNYVATYITNLNLGDTYVAKETGKGLSTNDYTTAEKNKLSGIAAGAEVNVNADWEATSGDAEILHKPSIPSKTSDLTNDSGFITTADIPEGAAASTTVPKEDGTAAVGEELAFARGDHRHPSDTKKADKSEMSVTSSGDQTTITLKSGTSATVINAHQSISGKVDKTTTVNGHALSGNVTVTKSDVSLGNVTNDAQVKRTEMGAANGVATLDANGIVPSSQLPSFVDDVIEAYARSGQTALSENWLATGSASGTVIVPEAGKIYVLMADSGEYTANSQFRWGGTTYVKLNDGGVSAITNAEIDSITSN